MVSKKWCYSRTCVDSTIVVRGDKSELLGILFAALLEVEPAVEMRSAC